MMNRINTEIDSIIVEIEDKEYPVAEKTVDVAEQLLTAQKRLTGEPQYKLWLAELEILLGKAAVKELFNSGKRENIDRLQRIHSGVLRAFEHNAEELRNEEIERQREQIVPMTDFIRQMIAVAKFDSGKPVVRMPVVRKPVQ